MKDDELTIEQWDMKYMPINNPLNENASWDGALFETYGDELEFVQEQDEHNVWTFVDSDLGTSLLSGYYVVNRIGYLVTKNRWEEYCEIGVSFDGQ